MEWEKINQISDTDLKRVLKATVDTLRVSWAIATVVNFTQGTQICYHKMDRYDNHTLVFGLKCVRSMMYNGSAHHAERGWEAVVTVACHEMAHALQCDLGMRYHGSVHNEEFFDLYARMRKGLDMQKILQGVR